MAWLTLNKKGYFQYVPPLFITLLLTIGQISFGMLDSYVNLIAAIATAVITEWVLSRWVFKIRKSLSSAYISGISVGILIRSAFLWPYVIASMLSIMSKYVLRYKDRHLWNPSNFGVSWMLFMAPADVAGLSIQWGSSWLPLVVIWMLGLVIVYQAKRLHVTLTYVISFIILAYVRSLIVGDTFWAEVSPLTGPMYQLFVFFMITDPATNVSTRRGQILVAVLVACVEFFLRLNSFIYAPFYALFIVGPIARFIDLKIHQPKPVAQIAIAR
ncbi:NQR2/RnfD/RnfE family subunit of NADH-ubiquinone oxidoreductase [Thermoflavifilum aggregans]|uniref:NQR2/RnfD/RnfE family subunit of NADH-ubiquinone oxidoreductase n=1 Tax=Thermoflavifilum aggregans TaxID=454188 RepID=A0A2M9CSA1_9BACT|nr:RnfABCDGE type electron transport complex subunit D [Thermoflavifilum aggregans]PJJ74769.1 NQR2/RnfD/RnfE family subunit of NADH-ubiquinone oxidoreductase [Thermoflavifilum aggregans]